MAFPATFLPVDQISYFRTVRISSLPLPPSQGKVLSRTDKGPLVVNCPLVTTPTLYQILPNVFRPSNQIPTPARRLHDCSHLQSRNTLSFTTLPKYTSELALEQALGLKISRTPEFLFWLSGLQTQLVSVRRRVRSLASLCVLRIWRCCGCSVGQLLRLQFDPWPGNFHMP